MHRLVTVIAACCVPAVPLAAQTTVTPDTYQPEPAESGLSMVEIEQAAVGAFAGPGPEAASIESILQSGQAEFSPRAQLVVRPTSPEWRIGGGSGGIAVPAPSAMVLLGLAGLVASRRQRQVPMRR